MFETLLSCANECAEVREKVLANFHAKILSIFLNQVTSDSEYASSVAAQSYKHELGFVKIVLANSNSGSVRLHIWQNDTLNGRTDPHDHFWSFSSLVLRGAVRDTQWIPYNSTCNSSNEYDYFVLEPLKSGNFNLKFVERVVLSPRPERLVTVGSAYSLEAGTIHGSYAQAGTATLLVHGRRQVVTNRVFRASPSISRSTEGRVSQLGRKEMLDLVESCRFVG